MSDDFLEVRVMDWITDNPSEQRSHQQVVMNSFKKIKRLEIRLTGWTINQTKRIHVGVNSVPTIIYSVMFNATIQELSIDLECLAKEPALSTFISLISTSIGNGNDDEAYASMKKLTISCSGEEEISSRSLQKLGGALKSLRSISTLNIVGINARHLSTILSIMRILAPPKFPDCIPRLSPLHRAGASYHASTPATLCRRITPKYCCNPYASVETLDSELAGYPNELKLEKVSFTSETLADLVHLLHDDAQCTILSLVLEECIQLSEDLDFLGVLLEGRTILKELSLHDYTIMARHMPRPWWKLPATRAVSIFPEPQSKQRLLSLQLIDVSGQRNILEVLAHYVASNDRITKLHVRNTYAIGMANKILGALHTRVITKKRPSGLTNLGLMDHSGLEQISAQLLSEILGCRGCILGSLRLHIIHVTRSQLDVLGDCLIDNTSLRFLSLSGSQELNVVTLECFVSMLNEVANLKGLNLNFPAIDEDDKAVIDIFESNTTLKEVTINTGGTYGLGSLSQGKTNDIMYFGIRNSIRSVLLSHGAWTLGLWKAILCHLLSWHESRTILGLEEKRKDLVLLSGIWFALTECPQLIYEMEPFVL